MRMHSSIGLLLYLTSLAAWGQEHSHADHSHHAQLPADADISGHVPPDPPSHSLGPMTAGEMIEMMAMDDAARFGSVIVDQFEWREHEDPIAWEASAWYGGDYDKLLLTTGSRVRTLDVPGHDLDGVRYLRTMDDSVALRSLLRDGANVLVVGGGWIGLETAAAARTHGAAVRVVERDQLPLRRVLGDEVATVFRDLHEAHGVVFHFGCGVTALRGSVGRVTHAMLTDGTEVAADVVLIGVGIVPDTGLAEAAGLEVDDGILTDEFLRTGEINVHPLTLHPDRIRELNSHLMLYFTGVSRTASRSACSAPAKSSCCLSAVPRL